MNYNEQLEELLNIKLLPFAKEYGFQIKEKEHSPNHGAFILLINEYLKLRLVVDRGLVSLEITSVFGKEDFYDLDLLIAHLKLNPEIKGIRRRQVLGTILPLDEQINFLKSYYSDIKDIYSREEFKKTYEKLSKLGEERFYGNIINPPNTT